LQEIITRAISDEDRRFDRSNMDGTVFAIINKDLEEEFIKMTKEREILEQYDP